MVEGDLVDLTLPTLLHALSRERSTSVLRLQCGDRQGTVYFCEGVLIHALSGRVVGDRAMYELLDWTDGRFRLVRDADQQPRTITQPLEQFLRHADRSGDGSSGNGHGEAAGDERLLTELLTLLSRLEQDRVKLAEVRMESGDGGAPLLVTLATVVNSLIAFVAGRSSDPTVLPSYVLPRLAEKQPYTQLLGEDHDRISVATVAGVLKNWHDDAAERQRLLHDLCRALFDVLAWYGNAAGTFFHESREREEWRATFDVFADGLWSAIEQGQTQTNFN